MNLKGVHMASKTTIDRFHHRRYLIFALAVLTPIFIYGPLALADQHQAPKMVLKERDFDFGEVRQGKTITHSFEVRNQGDVILTIKKINPG